MKVYPCIPVGSDWSVRPCHFLIIFLSAFFLYNIAFSLFITHLLSRRVRSLSLEPHGSPPSHVVVAHSRNQINPNAFLHRIVPSWHVSQCLCVSLYVVSFIMHEKSILSRRQKEMHYLLEAPKLTKGTRVYEGMIFFRQERIPCLLFCYLKFL